MTFSSHMSCLDCQSTQATWPLLPPSSRWLKQKQHDIMNIDQDEGSIMTFKIPKKLSGKKKPNKKTPDAKLDFFFF